MVEAEAPTTTGVDAKDTTNIVPEVTDGLKDYQNVWWGMGPSDKRAIMKQKLELLKVGRLSFKEAFWLIRTAPASEFREQLIRGAKEIAMQGEREKLEELVGSFGQQVPADF